MTAPNAKRGTRLFSRKTLAIVAVPAALIGYLLYFSPEQVAARKHLGRADVQSKVAIELRLRPVTELFAKARQGARPFAEEALSWSSKWALVKGLVDDGQSHRQYLAEAFARHVFAPDDLRGVLEFAVRAYLSDLEGIESEMLVGLRADLANFAPEDEPLPAFLHGDAEFRGEYQKMSERVGAELRADLGVVVGREVGMLVATEIATQAALQAAKAAALELGVSAGLLGSGAVSLGATLGVGLVISIILDYLLDAVFHALGYDPAAKIEALVLESINKLEAALLRAPGQFSGAEPGSLRRQLEDLHASRSKLRRETVNRLLEEGDE